MKPQLWHSWSCWEVHPPLLWCAPKGLAHVQVDRRELLRGTCFRSAAAYHGTVCQALRQAA